MPGCQGHPVVVVSNKMAVPNSGAGLAETSQGRRCTKTRHFNIKQRNGGWCSQAWMPSKWTEQTEKQRWRGEARDSFRPGHQIPQRKLQFVGAGTERSSPLAPARV